MPGTRGAARQIVILALIALAAVPAAADAKPKKRHPVSVDVEFSFTGLAEYKHDMDGTTLTCPDSSEPYRYDDQVRAHIAFDTVWKVCISLKPHRRARVFDSKKQS